MSAVHFHLYFSHFPIAGIFIGIIVVVFGKFLNQQGTLKTGLWIVFLASFAVFAMNKSGEGAEELVEELRGVSHHQIHEHEEAAEKTVWLALISGLMGLFVLWALQTGQKYAQKLVLVLMLLASITAGFVVFTAQQGGLIRHAEELGSPVQTEEK